MTTTTQRKPTTRGTWGIHPKQRNIIQVANRGIFVAQVFEHDTSRADAQLISAAPELLEALEDLLAQVQNGCEKIYTTVASNAIRKALGQRLPAG